jgi:hypothetical protein
LKSSWPEVGVVVDVVHVTATLMTFADATVPTAPEVVQVCPLELPLTVTL